MSTLRIEETPEIPEHLRHSYLATLLEAQELYVEQLVLSGRRVLIHHSGGLLGYAVVHDTILVEVFLRTHVRASLTQLILSSLIEHCGITASLCKSFDAQMLYAASCRPAQARPVALLFRSFISTEAIHRVDVSKRRATMENLAEIESIHDGFFDSETEISEYIAQGGLFIYGIPGAPAIGCGVMKRIIPNQVFVDLGMVVAPSQRRRGLGSYIVSDLKERCLRSGLHPVCGCAIDNLASLRSLERAGFRCAHSLIEFAYQAQTGPRVEPPPPLISGVPGYSFGSRNNCVN